MYMLTLCACITTGRGLRRRSRALTFLHNLVIRALQSLSSLSQHASCQEWCSSLLSRRGVGNHVLETWLPTVYRHQCRIIIALRIVLKQKRKRSQRPNPLRERPRTCVEKETIHLRVPTQVTKRQAVICRSLSANKASACTFNPFKKCSNTRNSTRRVPRRSNRIHIQGKYSRKSRPFCKHTRASRRFRESLQPKVVKLPYLRRSQQP